MITQIDPKKTENLSIDLRESEVKFLRSYANDKKTTVDVVIDGLIKTLMGISSKRTDPSLMSLVGILPAD